MVPWIHTESVPANGILLGSAVFPQLTREPNTHTQKESDRHTNTQTTLHAISVVTGHIYALHAGDVT